MSSASAKITQKTYAMPYTNWKEPAQKPDKDGQEGKQEDHPHPEHGAYEGYEEGSPPTSNHGDREVASQGRRSVLVPEIF